MRPMQTDHYKSDFVQLGGNAADGMLYQPTTPGANPHVGVVTTYQPPASELADRGYRTLLVRHLNQPGVAPSPFDGFDEISRGIKYMRKLPGVQKVVVAGWGSGATTMMLYVDAAEREPPSVSVKRLSFPASPKKRQA